MALKRATKSIPLSGGVTEEVDDFLLEPAGMQLMQNCRFIKKDRAEKSRGLASGVATGVSNYTQDLVGAWSDHNLRGAILGNNEISYTDDGGASFTTDSNKKYDLLGIRKVLSTAEANGGMNFSVAPIGLYTAGSPDAYNIVGWLVAYEYITNSLAGGTNKRGVVIQTYNTSGDLLNEVYEKFHSGPQCYELGNGFAGVVYTQTNNGNLKSRLASSSGAISSINNNDSLDIQLYGQYFNRSTGTFDGQYWGALRMGWSPALGADNSSLVAYHSPTNDSDQGIIGWKEEATGAIKIRYMSGGYPQGASATVATDTASVVTYSILDVYLDDTSTYAYILLGIFTNLSNFWDVELVQWDVSSAGINASKTIINNEASVPINGSVRQAPDGNIYVAFTRANGYPTATMQDTKGLHSVSWLRYSGGDWSSSPPSTVASGTIYSHRLCSNIACDKDSEMGMVVQQWDNWNPSDESTSGGDQNVYTITPTAKKPVTSILLQVGFANNDSRVVSTFDAAQSKAQVFAQDEQSTHKSGNLYYFSNDTAGRDDYNRWHYGNRVILTADDTFYWMDRTTPPDQRGDPRLSLLQGSARLNLYEVNSAIRVNTTSFSDGLFVGASTPAWYDAASNDVMSAAPLESPEIAAVVAASGDGASYNAYADLGVASEDPKVYTAVLVHTDAAGRVHRSAPSIPVYAGKLQAADTSTTTVTVHITSPISLQRAGASFIEIYEAQPGGDFQLAGTEALDPAGLTGADLISVSVGTNLSPATGHDLNMADYRASKTLYTEGGVLAADPWPNFDIVVRSGRRLFAHSIGDPSSIYYCKIFEPGVAPEFNASLVVTLANEIITAMGAIDDKLIIFTKNSCWVMQGTGPDNTGANGDFFLDRLNFPLGCEDQDSVIPYQDGIAFYSNTTGEFHLITRDLLLVDIGENISDTSERITDVKAAIVSPYDGELRWYCTVSGATEYVPASSPPSGTPDQPPRPFLENNLSGELMLVYDYGYQKWTARTYTTAMSNGIVNGGVILLNGLPGQISTSWVYRQETEDSWPYTDYQKWETPWIKVNQLQDFGRFYEATFIGKYLSSWDDTTIVGSVEAGDLQVTVKYDYEGASGDTDVYRWRANYDFDPADGDRLQFRVRPKRQKCQAIKFIIEEIATEKIELAEPTYTKGRGFILTAIDLFYGAKGGSGSKSLGSRRLK